MDIAAAMPVFLCVANSTSDTRRSLGIPLRRATRSYAMPTPNVRTRATASSEASRTGSPRKTPRFVPTTAITSTANARLMAMCLLSSLIFSALKGLETSMGTRMRMPTDQSMVTGLTDSPRKRSVIRGVSNNAMKYNAAEDSRVASSSPRRR